MDQVPGASDHPDSRQNRTLASNAVSDMMLEAVEKRFAAARAPHAIEHLSDNGSA